MTEFDRAYQVAKHMLQDGVFPTPTRMNQLLGHTDRVKPNMLNGTESQARTVALQEAGYVKHPVTGRWHEVSPDVSGSF